MKTLGILGGLGPQSTEAIYHRIIELCQQREGSSYPRIIINSVPLWEVVELLDDRQELAQYMISEMKKIEDEVDFFIMPCNGMHVVIDELRGATDKPFLAIYEEVASVLGASTVSGAAILGTKITTENSFYPTALAKQNIRFVGLSDEDEDALDKIIFDEILPGKQVDFKKKLMPFIKKAEYLDCDAVVLACTELPLFIKQDDCCKPVFSSTEALAQAAVKKLFE